MSKIGSFDKFSRAIEILSHNSADRSTLADSLGISLTAARNIADTLIINGIVGEYQKKTGGSGRSTNVLYLKNEPIFVVADILTDKITTYIFGYGINIIEKFDHKINDLLFLDDSYTSYFRNLSRIYPKLKCICFVSDGYPSHSGFTGTGVSGLDNLPLSDIAREHLGEINILFENKSLSISDSSDRLFTVVTESNGHFRTIMIHKGEIISGKNTYISALDEKISGNGRSYGCRLRYADSADEYVGCVCDYLDTILSVVDVKTVYFFSERYSDSGLILRKAEEKFILDFNYTPHSLPRLVPLYADSYPASNSLLLHVRNSYLKTLL